MFWGKRRTSDREWAMQQQISDLMLRVGEIAVLREQCKQAVARAEQAEAVAVQMQELLRKLTRKRRAERAQREKVDGETKKTLDLIIRAFERTRGDTEELRLWRQQFNDNDDPVRQRARDSVVRELMDVNRGMTAG